MSSPDGSLSAIFKINLLFNNLNRSAERKTGLSIVQWYVLDRILGMPASPAQRVSDALGLHPSTFTQTLKRLVSKDLIFIARDPQDSRKKLVSLTRKGFRAIQSARPEMDRIEKELRAVSASLRSVQSQLSDLRAFRSAPREERYFDFPE